MHEMFDERQAVRPVLVGRREVGAYATGPGGPVFVPVVDVTAIVVASTTAVTVIAVVTAAGLALRRRPAVGAVTMGHGGWVSVRHGDAPALRAARSGDRPWWARLLRARRLVVGR
ncbi:hypothetical protein [Actinoplanes rectilineatus]|uniref:hypothetical protein n=1 Tax=Actinoplanes rectilineatus TaxID=113571 RepID=UPI000AC9687D|nr:hypothetical protein [Actinoplanes rectilineatus]